MNETTERRIDIDGLSIRILEKPALSDRDKTPTLVLLHGMSMDNRIWERQFSDPQLSANRVIAIEFPGHGSSDWAKVPERDYAFRALGNIVQRVIASMDVSRYVLVGVSLGANLALQTIPHLTGCLGIIAITVPFSKPMGFGHFNDAAYLVENIYKEQVEIGSVLKYCALLVLPGEEVPSFLEDAFLKSDPKFRSAVMTMVGQGNYDDENDLINSTLIPVALVAGTQDLLYNTLVIAESPIPNIWRNQIQWITGAGHLPQWDNASAFNGLLIAFMQELDEK